MTEKKISKPAAKKIYKRPAQVNLVDSGKATPAYCPGSCGSNMIANNSNCGHY